MKHFIIDDHLCSDVKKTIDYFGTPFSYSQRDHCGKNTYVFSICFEFFIVTVNKCVCNSHEEFMQRIYNHAFKKMLTDETPYYRHFEHEIKKIQKEEFSLNDKYIEVSYLYGSFQKYCLAIEHPFIDFFLTERENEYEKTIKYISENDHLSHLKNTVDYLYKKNKIFDFSSDQKHLATIEALVKTINNKLK